MAKTNDDGETMGDTGDTVGSKGSPVLAGNDSLKTLELPESD